MAARCYIRKGLESRVSSLALTLDAGLPQTRDSEVREDLIMGWVDADAHVVESPLTWEYLLPSEQRFRPQLFKPEG